MLKRVRGIYREFPPKFWTVVGVMFIDRLGGNVLWPFFTLYITARFEVGMTRAGLVLGILSAFSLLGSMVGGGLTDRFGRKRMILIGLVFSAISTLSLGLVEEFSTLLPLAAVIGFLSHISGPAHSAMVADLLPEEQRQEGFGILRVAANLTWVIGPIIGGVIADRSYFALFVIDAVVSCLVAALVFLTIPETKPETIGEPESMLRTFAGYGKVAQDLRYIAFLLVSMLMLLVYQQMYSTLSVFLRDTHGVSTRVFGILMIASPIVVILFQFPTTRAIRHRPPFLMMALGTFFYLIGFGMFGFVAAVWLFALALIVITVGEMIIMPTSSALAANFAPEDMRGRYLAVYGVAWGVPSIVGPSAAGLILDNYNPFLLWYIGAGICAAAIGGFFLLQARLGHEERFQMAETA